MEGNTEKIREKLRDTYMSSSGVFEYLKQFDIAKKELDDPDSLILDLGAGTKQNLAKEVRELGLKSKVISIDPRLALSENEDLALPTSCESDRLEGRKNPEPLTLAALSESIPLKDESVNHVYASYSVPYYLENPGEIIQTIKEMVRILKPGGTIKIFPLIPEHREVVEETLLTIKGIHYNFTPRGISRENEDWLLVIKKQRKELEN